MSAIKTYTEDQAPAFSELVFHELDMRFSREVVTLDVTSVALPFGLVLQRGAGGSYSPLTETSNQGVVTLGDVKAVLLQPAPVSEATQEVVVIRRGAILNGDALKFDASVTTKKADAKLALSDLGIVIKE